MEKDVDIKALEKAFNGDLDLVLFFLSWIKNSRNATKAYLELNPHVDPASAQVLGSRQLAKIDRTAVMKSYGLGVEEYFKQIAEGHEATKWNDFTGEREPDHKTRKDYNDKIGKLLGIESDKPQVLQQFNSEGGVTYIIQVTKDEKEFNSITSESEQDIPIAKEE